MVVKACINWKPLKRCNIVIQDIELVVIFFPLLVRSDEDSDGVISVDQNLKYTRYLAIHIILYVDSITRMGLKLQED